MKILIRTGKFKIILSIDLKVILALIALLG